MNRQSIKILLLLLLLSVVAKAQLSWHQGELTLITGIKLHGEFCYESQPDVLLFRTPDKLRTYTTDQVRQFQYVDLTTNGLRVFATYDIMQPTGETRSIIFEEITPNALVPLLQLPALHGAHYWTTRRDLPQTRNAVWQTSQPRYVWIDGQLAAPDVFIETELDVLVAASPESVQKWADHFPKPTNPLALATWLAIFNWQVAHATINSSVAMHTNSY